MALTYTTLGTALSTITAIPTTDPNFIAIFPNAVTYAENRICRELDLVAANVRDGSASCTAGSPNFNLPTVVGTFLVVDGMNVITPANTAPDGGTRIPLIPVSRDFLNLVWPSSTGSTVPQYFAYITQDTYSSGAAAQNQVIFGPWPDATYRIEVIGKIQPAGLTAINPTTWISTNLPDLLLMASCIFMVGAYMKNFGAASDNPASAVSYESQYQTLKASADTWQARARFSGASWTSKQLEPTAQAQRG